MPRSIAQYQFARTKTRRLIKRAGLTITLAGAHLGLSSNSVGRWFSEDGHRTQPTINNLRRLAILLGCKMDDLTEVER